MHWHTSRCARTAHACLVSGSGGFASGWSGSTVISLRLIETFCCVRRAIGATDLLRLAAIIPSLAHIQAGTWPDDGLACVSPSPGTPLPAHLCSPILHYPSPFSLSLSRDELKTVFPFSRARLVTRVACGVDPGYDPFSLLAHLHSTTMTTTGNPPGTLLTLATVLDSMESPC